MFFNKPTTKSIGDTAESIAENFLIKNKLSIIEKNYRMKTGEIDLIANDQDTLVFIEVKYRKSTRFGHPLEMVTPGKQKKIIRTSQLYLQKHPKLSNKACRFDVISIHNQEIDWIKNAFDAL